MNFDFVTRDDQESLRRKLVYFHMQCPAREMWTVKQYKQVIRLLKERDDVKSEFIQSWIEELRPYSFYD